MIPIPESYVKANFVFDTLECGNDTNELVHSIKLRALAVVPFDFLFQGILRLS